MWSDERNAVRRVLDVAVKPRSLRLGVLRFGQSQPTAMTDASLLYAELTEAIIGSFYDVYHKLRHVFLESVYREALKVARAQKGMRVASEKTVQVSFRGIVVGVFRADLVVNDKIVL